MGGANAAPAPGLPASSCPAYGHMIFTVPIDDGSPSGFVTADLMTTTGYNTENVWVELGQSVTTSGVTVAATGDTRVQLGNRLNVGLDRNNGRLLFGVSGVYQITFSVSIKREEGATGTREIIVGVGLNGSPPERFVQAATSQQSTRWIAMSSTLMTNLSVGDELSLWVNQINDGGGAGVDEMEISTIDLVAVRLT